MAGDFPPAVKAAQAVLAEALDVPVGTRTPRSRPTSWVVVSPVGGSNPNVAIYLPRIVVECSAGTVGEVETLTNNARKALRDSQGTRSAGVFIRKWGNEFGPYSEPDPDLPDVERWKFHGDLNCSNK